jgi:hypothetical protein
MVRKGREKQRTLLLLVVFVIEILGMAVKVVSRGPDDRQDLTIKLTLAGP